MDKQEWISILESLHVNVDDSSRLFTDIQDAIDTPPVYGIARAVESFDWFYDTEHLRQFTKGDELVILPSLFYQLRHNSKLKKTMLIPSGKKFTDYCKNYNGHDLTDKTLLIWRAGGLGDILFIQPSIRYLKMKYPTCKIHFACAPSYFPLLKTWGNLIDKIMAVPFHLKDMQLADYHASFEGIIERCKDAEKINAYKIFSMKLGLDIPDSILRPVLKTNKQSNEKVKKFLADNNLEINDYICFQIRASSAKRTPPLDVWARILIPLLEDGHKIVVTDSPSVAETITNFINTIIPENLRSNFYSFCKLSETIVDSISLANYAKLVLAPDSSMNHIGAAVSTPVFGIFAPFDAALRLSTYKNSDWIQPEGKDDKLCHYGGARCFEHGHMPCAYNINQASPCFYRIDCEKAIIKIRNLMENGNA